jgi:hypothetical protein
MVPGGCKRHRPSCGIALDSINLAYRLDGNRNYPLRKRLTNRRNDERPASRANTG